MPPDGDRNHNFSRRAAVDLRLRPRGHWDRQDIQGGSNMTGTDLYVKKPHCAAAVRP